MPRNRDPAGADTRRMMIESFGSRARVGALWTQARDVAVTVPRGSTNPLLFAVEKSFSVGFSKRDEARRLSGFVSAAEAKWGTPVSGIDKPAHVAADDWNAFKASKAITLTRYNRTPAEVTELIVPARGSIDGEEIAPRDLFVQRYAPQGTPTGETAVIAPGFLETGRNYVELAIMLSAKGVTVLVLDQQWAGLSQGARGGVDRGFGIARDVAAVAARADTPHVTLVGVSMGGLGSFMAVTLNELGRIELQGAQMPAQTDAVLWSPYFATTRSFLNDTLSASGHIPLVRDIPLPALGAPVLSHDQATLRKLAAHAVIERISGRSQAFHAPEADLAKLSELPAHDGAPIYVMHGERDSLADYETSKTWAGRMGTRAHFESIDSNSHVMEENPAEQGLIFRALDWLRSQRG